MENPLVAIIMGSNSDIPVMEESIRVFEKFKVAYEIKILSAHRTPDEAGAYIKELAERGSQGPHSRCGLGGPPRRRCRCTHDDPGNRSPD